MKNYLKALQKYLLTYQIISIQEQLGLNANLSKKLEINLPVVVVGHLVLSKQCLIECVSPQTNKFKPEFPPKIFSHAVDLVVEWVVMEVILLLLGIIGKVLVLLQVIFMVMILVVNHINSLLVLTMSTVQSIKTVHLMNIVLLLVHVHAKVIIRNHIVKIRLKVKVLILYMVLKIFKLKL